MTSSPSTSSTPPPKRWHRVLYVQVLAAIVLGIAVGYFWPAFGKSLKPPGHGFVNLNRNSTQPTEHT